MTRLEHRFLVLIATGDGVQAAGIALGMPKNAAFKLARKLTKDYNRPTVQSVAYLYLSKKLPR